MNRQERVTQRRDREEKEGIYIYIYIERERERERECRKTTLRQIHTW